MSSSILNVSCIPAQTVKERGFKGGDDDGLLAKVRSQSTLVGFETLVTEPGSSFALRLLNGRTETSRNSVDEASPRGRGLH